MKFIFSLIIILLFSSSNINANDDTFKTIDRLFNNDEQLNEFLKKNKISKKQLDLIKKKREKEFDITKLKPFIPIAILIFAAIIALSGESSKQQNNTRPKKSVNNNQSRIDEFIKKSNKKNIDKEREHEFSLIMKILFLHNMTKDSI